MFKNIIFLLTGCACIWMAGCFESNDGDVHDYVRKVKSSKGGDIEVLPEVQAYKKVNYNARFLKSPFVDETELLAGLSDEEEESNIQEALSQDVLEQTAELEKYNFRNAPRPDADRKREMLEGFPIESIIMVGTLKKSGYIWGLVLDGNGTIHKVEIGNYIGEHSGKIHKITENKIYIREIVSDGQGGWVDRNGSISISNKNRGGNTGGTQ